MRGDIDCYFDKENDGFDGSSRVSRDEVDDLYALAQMITDAVKGAGFDYVVNTGFEKDDGTMLFGEV